MWGMDDTPYQSPTTEGAKPAPISPEVRAFDRELLYAIGANAITSLFAGLFLDGGRIAQHYAPFGIAHLLASLLMYFRAQQRGYVWTLFDRMFLRLGAPVGLVAAVIISS
jgi:hypothetical protein